MTTLTSTQLYTLVDRCEGIYILIRSVWETAEVYDSKQLCLGKCTRATAKMFLGKVDIVKNLKPMGK